MAYATLTDVQARMLSPMTDAQETVCESLLEDAAVLIDAWNANASDDAKLVVSCNTVIRALGSIGSGMMGVPMGATQGSASAVGYSQSWTYSSGGTGELYLTKTDKKMLGVGNRIGSYSPVEELAEDVT